jgi:hypothetical protein
MSKENDILCQGTRDSVNITLVEELGKQANKGMQSIIDVISKVSRGELSTTLTVLLEKYSKFISGISSAAEKLGTEIKDIGTLGRLSSRIGFELGTMTDSSEAHIAQLLVEDITSDMTETTRIMRECENTACSESVLHLARELIEFQEDAVLQVKRFL